MRQYLDSDKKTLKKVVCNQCGRELKLENGIIQEGVFSGEARWGYFSDKDGETHSFDLCETCFDRLAGGFQVPVQVEEETELFVKRQLPVQGEWLRDSYRSIENA